MPPELVKAHAKLDKAVDAAYRYKGANSDAERVAFLFGLYQDLIGALAKATESKPQTETRPQQPQTISRLSESTMPKSKSSLSSGVPSPSPRF